MNKQPAPLNNSHGFKKNIVVFTKDGAEEVHATIWEYDDGRPCEIYLNAGKAGTLVDSFLKEIGKNYSRLLQYGMTSNELASKLIGEVGPLAGETDWPWAGKVSGIQDLVARLLKYRYGGRSP